METKKRLHLSTEDKKIAGVCGGVAEYFNIDPVVVRVIWGVAALTWGVGIILYLVCAFVFPNKSEVE